MSNNYPLTNERSLASTQRSLTLSSKPQNHENSPQETSTSDDQQFLRLQLVSNITALLPMQQLSEVLTIPVGQVVPIPHMPEWVMGIYNLRGDILWVADLSNFLGLLSWNAPSTNVVNYTTVVLNINAEDDASSSDTDQTMGLIVSQTEDIERCNISEIQSSLASSVSPKLAQFLQGYWLNPKGEMLAVLDGPAMLDAMANR